MLEVKTLAVGLGKARTIGKPEANILMPETILEMLQLALAYLLRRC
jgi:hypothetical protein